VSDGCTEHNRIRIQFKQRARSVTDLSHGIDDTPQRGPTPMDSAIVDPHSAWANHGHP
jgi:hypothetical protein